MFKVGDRVHGERHGMGTVTKITSIKNKHRPITVRFDSNNMFESFTRNGCRDAKGTKNVLTDIYPVPQIVERVLDGYIPS